jgi:hypothetical protein
MSDFLEPVFSRRAWKAADVSTYTPAKSRLWQLAASRAAACVLQLTDLLQFCATNIPVGFDPFTSPVL